MEVPRLRIKKLDREVHNFSCGNGSVETMIENAYFWSLLEILYAYQIVIVYGDGKEEILGYIGIDFHEILPEDVEDEDEEIDIGRRFCYYAVEIKFLGIDMDIQGQRFGTHTMRLVLQALKEYHKALPYRFIYIDAVRERKSWYQSMGFCCMDDDGKSATIPMYIDLNENRAELAAYMQA